MGKPYGGSETSQLSRSNQHAVLPNGIMMDIPVKSRVLGSFLPQISTNLPLILGCLSFLVLGFLVNVCLHKTVFIMTQSFVFSK